jgi:beta-lactamase superfamily II metal-dependent hydrolase
MDIEINMLNVEDGDAIILMLRDQGRKSLIVIDGGYKKHFPKLQKRLTQLLPAFDNKIDLLICTHYDNDHIGGVEHLLDNYHHLIEEIWIHKIDQNLVALQQRFESKIAILENNFNNRNILENVNLFKSAESMQNALVIEGYKDLLRVVEKIRRYSLEDKVVEATTGKVFAKFPEFKVISPTASYYDSNLDELKEESIKEDLKANLNNSSKTLMSLVELYFEARTESGVVLNPCDELETSSLTNSVTATNMVSIVTLLEAEGKKYLFTGDSGIESFTPNTPNWENDLKDLYFLDIAHHGSKNNTSKKQLDIFNPKIAFVSGNNGPNRPSSFIAKCLTAKQNNERFEVTNADPRTWYLKLDDKGNFDRVLL